MKIISFFKKIIYRYHLFINDLPINLYSASIAYFLTIIFIPLKELIEQVLYLLNLKKDSIYHSNFFINIIYLISLIWVTSKLLNIILKVVNEIFNNYEKNLKIRFYAFIKMFLIFMFLIFLIFIFVILKEFINFLIVDKFNDLGIILFLYFFDFLFGYFFYFIILFFIYKLIIPVKIDDKYLIFCSIFMVLISKIIFYVFKVQVLKDFISFYYLKSFIALYILAYLFNFSLLYFKNKYCQLNN